MKTDNLGLGVLIGLLGGDESTVSALKESLNRKIAKVTLADEHLNIEFEGGGFLSLWDDGQSCCEYRYIRTDDRLEDFVGATLSGVTVKSAPPAPCEYGDHEIEFLEINTSKGPLTMASHNEHNGYYGGFWIKASFTK